MEIIGWVRQGDKTACGGIILDGNSMQVTDRGKQYTVQGARVQCQKNCVIVQGYPTAFIDGKLQVIHGMLTSSGCPCISTLNDVSGVGNDGGESVPETFKLGKDGELLSVYAPLKHDDCDYDQHIILEDQDGNPLSGIPYRLFDAQGAVIEGITAADGKTKIVAGNCGDMLDCEIAKGTTE